MAQMVAATSTAAITFADRTAASENLRALQAEPNVSASAIYSREGGVFASYARDGKATSIPKTAGPVGFSMEGQILIVFEPVELDGEQIGWIFLRIDGSEASERLLQYLYIMIGVFIASMAVTAVVSSILQRLVSQPILHLAETANRVARDKDYTLRAEKEREDEVGWWTSSTACSARSTNGTKRCARRRTTWRTACASARTSWKWRSSAGE